MRARAIRVAWMTLAALVAASLPHQMRADELTLVLAIKSGAVTADQRILHVRKDDRVRLRVTSDRPAVLHLHGYDIELNVAPQAGSEVVFTAHATGRYPIHFHAADAAPAGHAHRHGSALAYLEVRPR